MKSNQTNAIFSTVLLGLFILLNSLQTFGQTSTLKTDGQVILEVIQDEIILTTNPGFHLNDKAPAELINKQNQKDKPTVKSEKKFVFRKPKDLESVFITAFVCDDAKTVCEKQKHVI